MTLPRLTVLASLVALLLPAGASAGVRLVSEDVPLASSSAGRATAAAWRVLPARIAPARFNLAGVRWRGPGDAEFRTARVGGVWSAWRDARPEREDRPDAGTTEAGRRAGWTLGNPYWTGTARRLQVRVRGDVRRLRAVYVWSPVTRAPTRSLATAAKPAIITRAQWGADESIVRGTPSYATRVAFAVVHHTAGAKPSSAAQSAAMVRGIQSYHVRSNGWNDIGYNFLVDPFGQVFEGRKGGVTKAVVGAHAQGFNTGSAGVAVLGTYETSGLSKAGRAALVSLLAWRLDLAHVDPVSRLTWISGGNPKYPAGTAVSLRAVSGHRDTGPTSCPGTTLYGALNAIAADVRALGGPKLFDPRVVGSVGGPVRFTARLSQALAWTVTVRNAAGDTVASGGGTGTAVDWTWSSSGAPPDLYTYRIEAGPNVRPATGAVAGVTPLAITSLTAVPGVVTPNGDGRADRLTIRLTVTRPANVAVTLENGSGATVATLVSSRALAGGSAAIAWRGGKDVGGVAVPDGRYTLVARATSGSESSTKRAAVTVDRTLGHVSVTPNLFSPNGDGRRETATVGLTLAREAGAKVRVFRRTTLVATLLSGPRAAGRTTLAWNGGGLADGVYRVVVTATTALGTRKQERTLTLDTTRPRVQILAARRRPSGTLVRLRLSEASRIRIRLGGQTVRLAAPAGLFTTLQPIRASSLTVYSTDYAGNDGRAVSIRVGG